ncbi:MAG TPA: response regulator transcription factor [Baekduia sp.]|nr:response regulator transcription factor [Baekduia sp.]
MSTTRGSLYIPLIAAWAGRTIVVMVARSPKSGPVRVLLVDDQPYFLSAARDVFASMSDFEVVGETDSGEGAVDAVDQLHPDLVLLDIRMPGIGGIESARRINASHPRTVVVLISIEDHSDVSEQALHCGAAAMLRKQDFGPAAVRRLWAEHGI